MNEHIGLRANITPWPLPKGTNVKFRARVGTSLRTLLGSTEEAYEQNGKKYYRIRNLFGKDFRILRTAVWAL